MYALTSKESTSSPWPPKAETKKVSESYSLNILQHTVMIWITCCGGRQVKEGKVKIGRGYPGQEHVRRVVDKLDLEPEASKQVVTGRPNAVEVDRCV